MTDCVNKNKNLENCNCTYDPCSKKGICCECILYHRKNKQLPACFFTPQVECTFDRSIERFIRQYKR